MPEPETESRQRLDTIRARMAAPAPTPEELAAGDAEDRALVPRIHAARPGVPTHHILATLQTLRALRAWEASKEPAPAVPVPGLRDQIAGAVDAATGPQIAYRIRAELVCCRIFGRVNDTHELTIKQALKSRDWHDLCYWGEAAARIAEGRCPGYETDPNVCRCGCTGCQTNCGAHDETWQWTEAEYVAALTPPVPADQPEDGAR